MEAIGSVSDITKLAVGANIHHHMAGLRKFGRTNQIIAGNYLNERVGRVECHTMTVESVKAQILKTVVSIDCKPLNIHVAALLIV